MKVYDHADIQILQGNCLEILPTITEQVDLIFTSPPYPGAAMWESDIPTLEKLNYDSLKACANLVRQNGVICWQIGDMPNGKHGTTLPNAANTTVYGVRELGLNLVADVIWNKGVPAVMPPAFMRRPAIPRMNYEHIIVFFKGDWVPRELKSGLADLKTYMANGVWRINPETTSTHIAPYPYELARRVVGFWSLEGDLVLDPFCGGGTTLRVCKDTHRRAIGIEISPEYTKMSIERVSQDILF